MLLYIHTEEMLLESICRANTVPFKCWLVELSVVVIRIH